MLKDKFYTSGISGAIPSFDIRTVLQNAVRARDDFLSVASHELKTPLTTLKLQSQLMQRTLLRGQSLSQEETRRFVDSVVKQSDRLTRLLEDMLDISHIRAGTLSMRAEECCLAGLAKGDQERVFQKFERAVSASEAGGMGLGLFIARQLVELHGGALSIESDLGKGAEFVMRVPVTRGNENAQQNSDS